MTGVLDHTMLRVTDIADSVTWYSEHLGYEVKDRHDAADFTIVYMGPKEMHDDGAMLELTSNEGQDSLELGDAWGQLPSTSRTSTRLTTS